MLEMGKRVAGELIAFYIFLNIAYFILYFLSFVELNTRMVFVSIFLLAISVLIARTSSPRNKNS